VRGVFVTGTDTGAGKTVLASAICASLRAAGTRVAAFKPVVTGLDEVGPDTPPPDHELLAACAGGMPEAVAPQVFGPPVSPHLAAELAGVELDPAALVAAAHTAAQDADVLVCEGVGGLLVPFTRDYSVRDFAVTLGLPVVIAARPGLGTINHTLLTVEAARSAGLDVRAIVLGPWPDEPSPWLLSNLGTIADLTGVAVHMLPTVGIEFDALAAAGARLPVETWLGP